MSRRYPKSSGPARKPVFVKATVEFVNLRTVRVRTDEGEMHFPDLGDHFILLPMDRVEIELLPSRRNKPRSSRVVSAEWNAEYQIAAQVLKKRVRGEHLLTLMPIGFELNDVIEINDKNSTVKHGDYVVAKIARKSSKYFSNSKFSLIRIVRRLESVCDIANAVAVSRFGIRDEWPQNVLSAVSELPEQISQSVISSRRDIRHLPFITIDPESAKDHDDAVYCEQSVKDEFQLMVAIADVSHYVLSSSEIDMETRARGTSIYLPTTAIPMLPEQLSGDLCSLRCGKDRLAIVCDMTVNSEGNVVSYEFYEAVINSHARLSYLEVDQDFIQHNYAQEIASNLKCLFDVHDRLLKARTNRGTLEFDISEAYMEFDDTGDVASMDKSPKVLAHSLIEEAMLAANVCAAELIHENYPSAGMYRTHDEPSKRDLVELNGILKGYGVDFPIEDSARVSDYQSAMKKLSSDSQIFKALQIHFLRSLSTAIYSEDSGAHFALNYPIYTHFTSPIRRFPDLIVHRLIKDVLHKSKKPSNRSDLHRTAVDCSYLERRAEACSRESEKWLKAHFMRKRLGETYGGVIVDIKSFGIFVQLDSPYVSGMISISRLGNEYFNYEDSSRQLIGSSTGTTYRIGMFVNVRVSDANPELGFIDFELENKKPSKFHKRKRGRR